MRNRYRISFLICVVFGHAAQASTGCSTAIDHVSERECLARAAAKSKMKLEQVRDLLAKRIETWDEESSFKQRTLARFKQSFTRFEIYRDAECEYEASAAAGGNGAGDMRLSCQIDLNKQYANSLRGQLNWYKK